MTEINVKSGSWYVCLWLAMICFLLIFINGTLNRLCRAIEPTEEEINMEMEWPTRGQHLPFTRPQEESK